MESTDLSYRRLELCVQVAFLRSLLSQARELRENMFLRSFVEGFDKRLFALASLHCEQVREAFEMALVELWSISDEDCSGVTGIVIELQPHAVRLPLAS